MSRELDYPVGESDNRPSSGYGTGGGSGKEQFSVSSGYVVLLDQFMLGNRQFVSELPNTDLSNNDAENVLDSTRVGGLQEVVHKYGGVVFNLPVGTYDVFREPQQMVIAFCPSEKASEIEEPLATILQEISNNKGQLKAVGRVFVDTRCLVIADPVNMLNQELLQNYRGLRVNGREKEARDLLRSKGAAVRYGFHKYGDEFGVFKISALDSYALWPDVIDSDLE